jgi:hypothetical protein
MYPNVSLIWLAALCAVGCVELPLATGAREIFSRERICPIARVTVDEGADLPPPHTFLDPAAAPPAEVQDDAERLALWKDRRAAADAFIDDRYRTFKVDGCGHQDFYVCAHPGDGVRVADHFVGATGSKVGNVTVSSVGCSRIQPLH